MEFRLLAERPPARPALPFGRVPILAGTIRYAQVGGSAADQ